MNRSDFILAWHMIIRGNTEETLQSLDSLQGLYDECIIAVDSRLDSDEVYEALKIYPNTYPYRQVFDDFGRYDLIRQDALNRVSRLATYVGFSDNDEVLVQPKAREVREWLLANQPDAVSVGLTYQSPVGGYEVGPVYPRTRIWKKAVERRWTRPCHEHPSPLQGEDNPSYYLDMVFSHIKRDPGDYRASHHIELMQGEIDQGNIGWIFFQAREYKYMGDFQAAMNKYEEYLLTGHPSEIERGIYELLQLYTDFYKGSAEGHERIKNFVPRLPFQHPVMVEQLAIAEYYLGDLPSAKEHHELAKTLDVAKAHEFIWNNDKYFVE